MCGRDDVQLVEINPMESLVITVADPNAYEVRVLVECHLDFAREFTPPEDVHALSLDGLLDPSTTLFSCRRNDDVVGIGALRQLDNDHAEVKSMHTATAVRGQGIGRALLDHMIAVAAARGVHRVSLETGSMDAFAAARSLYTEAGFQPCDPFGDYPRNRGNTFMTMVIGESSDG